jgi:hypothetical protein
MLMCRICNTRFEKGPRMCPNCGRRTAEHATTDSGSTGSGFESKAAPLPPARERDEPARKRVETEDPVEVEVDVDLELVVDEVFETDPDDSESKPQRPLRGREPGPAVLSLDSRQVRTLVSEQPGLLQKGMAIYADDEGELLGLDFETPVGGIDLLAQDRNGGFVVVMVPEPGELATIIPEILVRIGWVRKHMARGADVHGVVVVEQLPESVAYAAAGLTGTVGFKAVRVALTFHDLTP